MAWRLTSCFLQWKKITHCNCQKQMLKRPRESDFSTSGTLLCIEINWQGYWKLDCWFLWGRWLIVLKKGWRETPAKRTGTGGAAKGSPLSARGSCCFGADWLHVTQASPALLAHHHHQSMPWVNMDEANRDILFWWLMKASLNCLPISE